MCSSLLFTATMVFVVGVLFSVQQLKSRNLPNRAVNVSPCITRTCTIYIKYNKDSVNCVRHGIVLPGTWEGFVIPHSWPAVLTPLRSGVRIVAGAVGDLPYVLDSPEIGATLGGLEDVQRSANGDDDSDDLMVKGYWLSNMTLRSVLSSSFPRASACCYRLSGVSFRGGFLCRRIAEHENQTRCCCGR